jgi:hypothetical protein
VIQYAFENYAVQRNYDLSYAFLDTFFLDADERLTADLKEEIIKTITPQDSFLPIILPQLMFKNMKLYVSDC